MQTFWRRCWTTSTRCMSCHETLIWTKNPQAPAYQRLYHQQPWDYHVSPGKLLLFSFLLLIGPKTFETRGHCLKIQKRYCRTKLRTNFFGFRIVNMWNGLPDDVVLSPALNSFNGRIDRHWRSLRYSVFWWCYCLLMIWFNGSDLISPKANNGLLQPRLQDDDDDDEMLADFNNPSSVTK